MTEDTTQRVRVKTVDAMFLRRISFTLLQFTAFSTYLNYFSCFYFGSKWNH